MKIIWNVECNYENVQGKQAWTNDKKDANKDIYVEYQIGKSSS